MKDCVQFNQWKDFYRQLVSNPELLEQQASTCNDLLSNGASILQVCKIALGFASKLLGRDSKILRFFLLFLHFQLLNKKKIREITSNVTRHFILLI